MPDILATFECHAKEAAANVSLLDDDPARIREAVEHLTQGCGSIVLGLGEFMGPAVAEELRKIPKVLAAPTDEQLSVADAGVSDAFAGVASSGSICIAMGPPLVAAASLLMPLHIVLLEEKRIVARPRDLFNPHCLDGEGLRRNLVFITGPSATADMGPLVRGVHGPHRLQVLLLRNGHGH